MASTRTINDIILHAFYKTGEYSPDERPKAAYINEGLYYLNSLIDSWANDTVVIPYFDDFSFTLTAGKSHYTIKDDGSADVTSPDIISIPFGRLSTSTTNYPLKQFSYPEVWNIRREWQSEARPSGFIYQKGLTENYIDFFKVPESSYSFEAKVKIVLSNLTLQSVISAVPLAYHRFLEYALARELTEVYHTNNWSAKSENEYNTMLNNIRATSQKSVAIKPTLIFGGTRSGRIGGDIFSGV